MSKLAVKIIDDGEGFARVGGYGAIFGGLDIQGEQFSKDTDFMLDLVPTKMITYDHTLKSTARDKAVKHFLGESVSETPDDVGIWVEAQLDKSRDYVKQVLQLIERGVIGWSSGTAAHLATKKGDTITRWPIVEYSLTPTPAEPRALGVVRLKSLVKNDPGLEAVLLEDPESGSRAAAMAGFRHLQLKAAALLMVNQAEKLK